MRERTCPPLWAAVATDVSSLTDDIEGGCHLCPPRTYKVTRIKKGLGSLILLFRRWACRVRCGVAAYSYHDEGVDPPPVQRVSLSEGVQPPSVVGVLRGLEVEQEGVLGRFPLQLHDDLALR